MVIKWQALEKPWVSGWMALLQIHFRVPEIRQNESMLGRLEPCCRVGAYTNNNQLPGSRFEGVVGEGGVGMRVRDTDI